MSDEALEKAFYEIAAERGLLTAQSRGDVERAVARAAAEGSELTPWRAAFVRGYLNRAETDRVLADAGKRIAASALPELSVSAEDDGLDFRFGQLAIETQLIEEDMLDRALTLKKKRGRGAMKIGEALIEVGGLRPSQRDALLYLQDAVRNRPASDAGPPDQSDLVFGTVALENRLVGARDLDAAIAEQQRLTEKGHPRPLGDILVARNALTAEARDLVLELQRRRSTRAAAAPPSKRDRRDQADPDSIGRVIVENRLATEAQIEECSSLQSELREKGLDRPLGDLLVLKGYVDRGALETLLKAQQVRRKVALVRRHRAVPDSLKSESPLTLVAAVVVAAILSFFYALSTGGLSGMPEEPEGDNGRPRVSVSTDATSPPTGAPR